MRIIGGTYKGRTIRSPKGLPVRPTTDRTKEALFNRLNHLVELAGIKVLDLFAGTGNMTLEFWSRGARQVVSVDQHHRCVGTIKQHLRDLQIRGGSVIRMDARRYVSQATESFDLIFMDPPYALPGQPELVEQILAGELLTPDGILIVEHSPQLNFEEIEGFEESRIYGSSALSTFYAREE